MSTILLSFESDWFSLLESGDKKFEYRFFVDFEGKLGDAAVRNALKGIGVEALKLKILGNY